MAETQENNKNKNKIHSKQDIYAFTSQLDYNIETASERIELLNSILYTDEGYQAEFFENLFDQDARIKANALKREGEVQDKTRRINLFPTTKQPLSHDIYECKQLEYMGTYILTAPDQPRMDRQQEYNFYDEESFKKLIEKEQSYHEMMDKINRKSDNGDLCVSDILAKIEADSPDVQKGYFSKKRIDKLEYIDNEGKMAYLKRLDNNYKFDGVQRITKKDLKDKDLAYIIPYQEQIDKNRKILKRRCSRAKRRYCIKSIQILKYHQILYKDSKKGTIYFKNPLKDSTKTDYDQVDFFDKSHVLALINMPKRQITDDSDLSIVLHDLEVLMKNIKIREEDIEVVKLYRNGLSQEEIAVELRVSQQNVSQIVNRLADSVIQEYERVYEDWYYLDRVKGKYKKCSKCGEVKIHSKFGKDNRISDGLKSFCKKCDNLSKKS